MNENQNLFDYLSAWWENRRRANTSAKAVNHRLRRLVIGAILIMAVCVLLFSQNVWASTNIAALGGGGGTFLSDTIHYQGYLSDAQGQPINSSLDLLFRIYSQQTDGTPEWQETHPGVVVSNGMFSVRLGSLNPFPTDLFSQENDLWLGITIEGEELSPREPIAAAAYAINAGGSGSSNLPVGTVISWWRPNATTPLPSNDWMIADGSVVTDEDSPYYGQNLPDLTDKFIMGVGTDQIGQTGGNNWLDLSHSHQVDSHTHSIPNHSHGNGDLRANVAVEHDRVYVQRYGSGFSATHSNYTNATHANTHVTDNSTDIDGSTSAWSGTSGSSKPDTNSKLSSTTDNRPAYIGLVYLIKVK